jgi:LDH2 family malate/lactate/ureidoglycolate dehydrogenase
MIASTNTANTEAPPAPTAADNACTSRYYVVAEDAHNGLVKQAFTKRGYSADEAADMARLCADAARHGIRTHNAIKALHLDQLFGSAVGGCVPGARIEALPCRFPAARSWNANRKLGPSVAYAAIDTCIELADQFGIGMVSVDQSWHYLWGGGYVLEAARRGYIAYTNCTAMLAEVVPFGGRTPTLGTNPHSWAFPTTKAVGFPILVDWATSTVAMGRVQQLLREGTCLPPGCAVDAQGRMTTDPKNAVALLPFGGHKGYGLGLIDEVFAGFIGGFRPTLRGRFADDATLSADHRPKRTTCFHFQVIHPEAIAGGNFHGGTTLEQNLVEILTDILGHGNETAILPGAIEARMAKVSAQSGGLLFTRAEIDALKDIAAECGVDPSTLEPINDITL